MTPGTAFRDIPADASSAALRTSRIVRSRTASPAPSPARRPRPAEGETRQLIRTSRCAATERERQAALEMLVQAHLPLARSLAARYQQRGIELEDLEQVAALALMKAIGRYDLQAGTPFGAYATPTISGELRRHFRDHGWLVRPPRRLQEGRQELVKAREELTRRLGRQPTRAELAEALGVTAKAVREIEVANQNLRPASLDAPGPNGQTPLEQVVEADVEADPTSHWVQRLSLRSAIKALPREQQHLLHLRFVEDLTQSEVGEQLDMTPMTVSRLQRKALAALALALPRSLEHEHAPGDSRARQRGTDARVQTPRRQQAHTPPVMAKTA